MPRAATRYQRRAGATSPNRKQAAYPSSSPRQALEQRLANKPIAQPLQDSDDSDQLVVKGAGEKKGKFLRKNEVFASGGVGGGDKPGNHPTRAQRRKQMTQAIRDTQTAEPKNVAKEQTKPTSSAPTSALRPSTAQPTLSKENSILDGIRPRRRQLSILQAPDPDESSHGLSEDSFALPDDESTPLHAAKAKVPVATSAASRLSSSGSRKRKLGSDEPVGSAVRNATKTRAIPIIPTPEPTLPPQPLSALRASGQKQRQKIHDDDEDIMAPPMSSSSAPSPAETKTPSVSKPRKPAPQPSTMPTEQLQSLMPTKRRKAGRDRKAVHTEFDIPIDSDPTSDPEQDSSFLPTRRKAIRSRPREKDKEVAINKSKQKQTKTKSQPLRTNKSKANTSTRLTLSRSTGNPAKTPSQQPSPTRSTSIDANLRDSNGKLVAAASSERGRRYGGSPLKGSFEEKENTPAGGEGEVLVERSDDEGVGGGGEKDKEVRGKKRSKWDEIDAWDMEFEEVEVWERSSEKNAR